MKSGSSDNSMYNRRESVEFTRQRVFKFVYLKIRYYYQVETEIVYNIQIAPRINFTLSLLNNN
jgi:hypothetical protein